MAHQDPVSHKVVKTGKHCLLPRSIPDHLIRDLGQTHDLRREYPPAGGGGYAGNGKVSGSHEGHCFTEADDPGIYRGIYRSAKKAFEAL